MRTTIALAPLALLAVGAIDLTAQTVWTANATTGVPNFQANGTVKTTTVDTTVHGRGVRPRMTSEGYGVSYVYIPLTAPNTTKFACIGLRAMDNSPSGAIRAEFVRQPRNGNAAPAVTLGAVTTVDAAGDGFQFRTNLFAVQVIDYSLYTYYIRVDMSYQGASTTVVASPVALDVSLSASCTQ